MLERVTSALQAIDRNAAFATEISCHSDYLRIKVAGVGALRLPISPSTAQKLQAVSAPAPFGRRDETVHDTSVRDTGEIPASRISIDPRWDAVLDRQLAVIADRLGLPADGEIKAVLDKLLVYGQGQFFAFHQDSERADDMIASLVVVLPSRHEGGALVVEHHKKKLTLGVAGGYSKDLSLVAFYADCPHEVQPVEWGHRVTLTYQIHHKSAQAKRAPRSNVDRLAASIKAYFETKREPPYSLDPPGPPDRLVYLLDHEYTQRSLGWKRLKGADRRRAAALREVANRLDAEVFLALADVHESWSCEEDGYGYGRYGYEEEEHDEDEQDEDEHRHDDGYELTELIDSDIELRHWVGSDDEPAQAIAVHPSHDEVCFTKASVEMKPFQSEHEGYMGNYGNTVDRWYHRAAVVMWPRARNFVLRAKTSPAWAMTTVKQQIASGAVQEARVRARELLPFWSGVASQEKGDRFTADVLGVTDALDDASLAFALLSPLGPDRLGAKTTPSFAALVERFGASWGKKLFTAWTERRRWNAPPWLPTLPRLSAALAAAGEHGKAVASWLLSREVAELQKRHVAALKLPVPRIEQEEPQILDDLLALLDAAAVLQAASVRDALLAFLVSPKTALPLLHAGALLQKLRPSRSPADTRALGLGVLYRHVLRSLTTIVAAPPRCPSDWSIAPPPGCACSLCKDLASFLSDRDQIERAWPLAKERRQHIHNVIDTHRLPVSHETTRRGSPFTLVLKKQRALFERAEALRARQKALLSWLRKQRTSFDGAKAPDGG
jgi:predicted 2-oxoglutarate/Fe(II)-dependent dioxygenase YbiX